MLRWLTRRCSNYVRITDYLSDRSLAVERARLDVLAAQARRDEAVREALSMRRMVEGCQAIVLALIEPGLTEQCTKVRLRDLAEAEAFGARVQSETGVEVVPYKCRRCPRQPVSTESFWHITHADPAKRGQRGKADPKPQARLLRHVAPETADLLRARVADLGEAS